MVSSAAQRLRWAAGANPDLTKILTSFESAVDTKEILTDRHVKIANMIVAICNVILQHEVLRSQSSESKKRDDVVLATFENWKEASKYTNCKLDNVTPVEENIMKLYSGEMKNSHKWISKVSEKIAELISSSQKELTEQRDNTSSIHDTILENIELLKISYNTHIKIMNDFKPLVKALVKMDGKAEQAQDFVGLYRKFSTNFASFFHLFKGEVNEGNVDDFLRYLLDIEADTEIVYASLLDLESVESGKSLGINCNEKDKADSNNGKGQQKNLYAVNVWRRVRMKLEGRDPDPGRKYTIQEQVRI